MKWQMQSPEPVQDPTLTQTQTQTQTQTRILTPNPGSPLFRLSSEEKSLWWIFGCTGIKCQIN